jgi:hypothetical protein
VDSDVFLHYQHYYVDCGNYGSDGQSFFFLFFFYFFGPISSL